ncbi:NAD(P)H-dependent oxidoreductase [Oricola sp.]|uniref:NADPH-dependent FMN reductase n=1 Tax=Oricola sp. TaxID=1979950 RepID=UPI0025EFFA26|nr:NAD(P)H-dependent oxidoreductase [Oricola sp.]MCI5077783.1 NAD(P)H-dependent oxidoreductase [Oricola sp.]
MAFPKILVFAGSVRSGSFNRQLAAAAVKTLALSQAEVTHISLADYPLPLVDEDLKNEKGPPENAVKLARLFAAHDGLFLASPEYNASIPPLVKNTIDWISLVKADGDTPIKPFAGLTVALGAASNGRLGGIRGLYHLRAVMMNVGTQVVSEQVSIHAAAKAFGEDGMPTDERQVALLNKTCRALLDHCTPGRGR